MVVALGAWLPYIFEVVGVDRVVAGVKEEKKHNIEEIEDSQRSSACKPQNREFSSMRNKMLLGKDLLVPELRSLKNYSNKSNMCCHEQPPVRNDKKTKQKKALDMFMNMNRGSDENKLPE